jgi:hypothetical protein
MSLVPQIWRASPIISVGIWYTSPVNSDVLCDGATAGITPDMLAVQKSRAACSVACPDVSKFQTVSPSHASDGSGQNRRLDAWSTGLNSELSSRFSKTYPAKFSHEDGDRRCSETKERRSGARLCTKQADVSGNRGRVGETAVLLLKIMCAWVNINSLQRSNTTPCPAKMQQYFISSSFAWLQKPP